MACVIPYEDTIYCPACGERLQERTRETGPTPYCPDCELTLWRNPTPAACATVVDDDRVLLIERGRGADVGKWALPGGHIESGESARAGAARELNEETNLVVNATDLTLIGEGFLTFESGATMVTFNYAAPVTDAHGTVQAGDDAAAARFWTREELIEKTPQLRASGMEQILEAFELV